MSGIRMDHYIEVDFTGFKKLIDELGGVEITTTKAIDDSKSHLDLEPGTHTLDGEQSLGLVRTRKSVGDGSDLGRIQLQQAFMKALMDQVKSVGVFTNPKKLFDLADTATKADHHRLRARLGQGADGLRQGPQGPRRRERAHGHAAGGVRPGRPQPCRARSRPRPSRSGRRCKQDRPIPASATKDVGGRQGRRRRRRRVAPQPDRSPGGTAGE